MGFIGRVFQGQGFPFETYSQTWKDSLPCSGW
jgi:hypothetical protein